MKASFELFNLCSHEYLIIKFSPPVQVLSFTKTLRFKFSCRAGLQWDPTNREARRCLDPSPFLYLHQLLITEDMQII